MCPIQVKFETIIWLNNPISGKGSIEIYVRIQEQALLSCIHYSTIYDSWGVKPTQIPSRAQVGKEGYSEFTVVHCSTCVGLTHAQICSGLGLHRFCECCHHHCKFMRIGALLSPSDTVSLAPISASGSYILSSISFAMDCWEICNFLLLGTLVRYDS